MMAWMLQGGASIAQIGIVQEAGSNTTYQPLIVYLTIVYKIWYGCCFISLMIGRLKTMKTGMICLITQGMITMKTMISKYVMWELVHEQGIIIIIYLLLLLLLYHYYFYFK